MGSFGEDLRMERIARGIALEDITAATKISQNHLVALEQNRFRQLPGGILSKGIVRGYVSTVGLDQGDWINRFLKACTAAGLPQEDERNWTDFAENVGKARIQSHEAGRQRLLWIGGAVLILALAGAIYLAIRSFA
jgi:cytoskeletal protein RodZ